MKPRYPGLFVVDEPESALSFTGCLALVAHLATGGTWSTTDP
jgi:predicted ATPase